MATLNKTFDEQLSGPWGTGTKLILAAWLVEIAAAIIGLFIAWITIYGAREEILATTHVLSFSDNLNAILGGIPFIMVAIIELCKIPLATAYFHAGTFFWRMIFLGGLLFLLIITFETMMNGFERNLATRTLVISETRDTAKLLMDDISRLKLENTELSKLTDKNIEENYKTTITQIEESRSKEIQQNEAQAISAQKSYNVGDVRSIKEEIKQIDKDLVRNQTRLDKETVAINNRIKTERSLLTSNVANEREKTEKRLTENRQEIRNLNAEEDKEAENSTIFFEGSVRERFAKRRKPLEEEQAQLISQLKLLSVTNRTHALTKNYDTAIREVRERFEKRQAELNKRRKELSSQIQSQAKKTDKSLKPVLTALFDVSAYGTT